MVVVHILVVQVEAAQEHLQVRSNHLRWRLLPASGSAGGAPQPTLILPALPVKCVATTEQPDDISHPG